MVLRLLFYPTRKSAGNLHLYEDVTLLQQEALKLILLKSELELMDDRNGIHVERVKNVIIELVHYTDDLSDLKYSHVLSEIRKIDF